jgi:glycosyltransferase involved in cell wall biosynthesis
MSSYGGKTLFRPRILHVINGWALGGIAQATLELVKATTPQYKHYAIGYCWLDTDIKKEFEAAGCDSIIAENENYPGFSALLNYHKIDIIVKQTGGGDNPNWVTEAYVKKIPVIENLHCPRPSHIPKDMCAFTVGQSEYTASKSKDRKVLVIPNICTLPIAEPRQFPSEEHRQIVVGRLARYEIDKLHHVIYGVAKIMAEYRHFLKFLLMGHEFNRQYYEEMKKVEIPNYFVVEGEQKDKLAALNRLDICINPTWEAGFEYCIVEAMSQGIPIITWQDSAGPEAAQGAGIICRKELFHLASAVHFLINNPKEYEIFSRGAINKVKALYSPEAVSKQYEALFQECLKMKGAS